MAPATSSSRQTNDGCSWQHRQQVSSKISPEILLHSLLMEKGRYRWTLRPESERNQDTTKPIAQDGWRAEGPLWRIWSQQLGPLLHRKRQRVCCMGRTTLITSQFPHCLRESATKHNATYRSAIQKVSTPGVQGADRQWVPSVHGSKDNTVHAL